MPKVAVVTGANKGLGLALVKGLCQKFDGVVYLTSRDVSRGTEAVEELKKLGFKPEYHQLDVSNKDSVLRFKDHIKEKYGGLDVLINNAAVTDGDATLAPCTYEKAVQVININYKSILIVEELIYPLVRNNGRILNISSNCGHLSNLKNKYWIGRLSKKDASLEDVNEFVEWYLQSKQSGSFNAEDFVDGGIISAYKVTKIALNAVTIIQQKKLESRNISINSIHPGYVQTDMTRSVGFFTPEQAAEAPLYVALEAPDTLKGAFLWYNKEVIDWHDSNADCYFTIKSLFEGIPQLAEAEEIMTKFKSYYNL